MNKVEQPCQGLATTKPAAQDGARGWSMGLARGVWLQIWMCFPRFLVSKPGCPGEDMAAELALLELRGRVKDGQDSKTFFGK